MNHRQRRSVVNALKLLENQVANRAADVQEDAGAVALRLLDHENQDAVKDRERALLLRGRAEGLTEAVTLIQGVLIAHGPVAYEAVTPSRR